MHLPQCRLHGTMIHPNAAARDNYPSHRIELPIAWQANREEKRKVRNKSITDMCLSVVCVCVNQSGYKIEIEIEFVKADELQMGHSQIQHLNRKM